MTLTSVSAGALGTAMLLYIYPLRMKAARLVGTDIVHAIPLTIVAGTGHMLMGNVNFSLLGNLLLGSIPGIIIGSMLAGRTRESVLRTAIAALAGRGRCPVVDDLSRARAPRREIASAPIASAGRGKPLRAIRSERLDPRRHPALPRCSIVPGSAPESRRCA